MGYADHVGQRLRAVRTARGLSLQDVERESDGRWKAAVVGSYERGDRNISASRLCELAVFYGIEPGDVLPEEDEPAARATADHAIVLDLARLDQQRDQFPGVSRFVNAIRVQRGDFNNRTLSVRADDLRSLAIIEDLRSASLLDALARAGILDGSG